LPLYREKSCAEVDLKQNQWNQQYNQEKFLHHLG
jgi:hypothetical protein